MQTFVCKKSKIRETAENILCSAEIHKIAGIISMFIHNALTTPFGF